ncbi:hypothetical protein H2200_012232 [Cladophialophora chaetospira]|uniref:Cytochrome P450 n=1 Tax=Cladophialophora chaetospira TaxID=386627 RepID=A0AA39CCP8_9EURO|nr:hypothetical protein H2200_012232 [Cladophialophora chaetospira]
MDSEYWSWSWSEGHRWSVWTLLVALTLGRLLWVMVYRVFFHPLAAYPGPFASKLSDLPAIFYAATTQDTYVRYAQHRKYGSVVRTGPNELCFSDAASIKDIYGQSGEPCLKAPFLYDGFTLTGTSSVFSTTDRNLHARMRRLMSHGFSQQGVLQFQSDIIAKVERFLHNVSSAAQPVNIHDPAHELYRDTISLLSFGQSFNLLEGKESQGAKDIETYFNICPLFGRFPLAKYLPFGDFGAARDARPRIIKFSQSCIDDLRQRLRKGTVQSSLLRHMVEAKDGETGTEFSNEELIENVVIFILAGSGTTATTLIYLLYELGKRPEMQKRLEDEIRNAFPDQSVFPNFEVATDLPYLNCVVQEVLRLRGPIPTVAPRVSPGKIIGGKYVPAGVIVSNVPYSTQRDPTAFPNPEEFSPDRWANPSPEMKIMHRPFATGPRNCIGMHLARVQLLITVCAIYQRYEVELDPKTTEEMMVMRDQGVMTASGKQLWVNITPRE